MEYVELIIAMTLMVMVMDWAGTSWYFLNRRAEAGDEKSRLKLEKVKKVIDNIWFDFCLSSVVGIFRTDNALQWEGVYRCHGILSTRSGIDSLRSYQKEAGCRVHERDIGIARNVNVKAGNAAGVFLTKEKRGILRLAFIPAVA